MIERHAETPIRIFLLIQNRLLRDAMHRLFRARAGFVVVGCSSPEDCSRPALLGSKCDVLVLDSLNTGWLPFNLQVDWETGPLVRCLLISMVEDCDQFFAAIKGGATGYLLKDASAVEVVAAVQATQRGEAACPPTLCAELFRRLSLQAREPAGASAPNAVLTIRQHRLAALAAKGMTNKEIASCLNLSQFTVRNHMHRIMKRVGVGSRNLLVHKLFEFHPRPSRLEETVAEVARLDRKCLGQKSVHRSRTGSEAFLISRLEGRRWRLRGTR